MPDPDSISVCTVAGSDPGGGAGIQGDLKTFAANGVWGLSVVTALTAQNSHECTGVWEAPPGSVSLQLETLVPDFDIRAFKTGMLWDSRIIREVDHSLPDNVPLVVDPVMVSSSGRRLLRKDAIPDLVGLIIPRATVITPNLVEAAALAGTGEILSIEGMCEAAGIILSMGAQYVVVKGGHLEGAPVDLLAGHGKEKILVGSRFPFEVHGTGCCFAAAVAAHLACGDDVPEACRAAKRFVSRSIRSAFVSRTGHRIVRARPLVADRNASSRKTDRFRSDLPGIQ